VEAAIDVDCLVLLVHFGVVVGAIVDERISKYVDGVLDRVEDVVPVSSTVNVVSHVDSVDVAVVSGPVAVFVVSAIVVSVVYSGVVIDIV